MVAALSLAEWPDALHVSVLRHLGGPQELHGYIWPYRFLCRSTCCATTSPALWHDVDLGSTGRQIGVDGPTVLRLLQACKPGVIQRVSLYGLDSVDDAIVTDVASIFAEGGLMALDVGRCNNVSGPALLALASIPTLQEVGFQNIAGLEDKHIKALCQSLPNLTSLDVRHCEGLTDATCLCRRAGSWRSLQFEGCFRLDMGMFMVGPATTWDSLESLSLDGEELTSGEVVFIAGRCPRLRCFTVSFAREVDSNALVALSGLGGLQELTLRKASMPCDNDWAQFFSEQHTARRRAQLSLPQWQLLNVSECDSFADCAAGVLASVLLQPANVQLLDLDLSWCWHLTDLGIRGILAAAPRLRRVKLAGVKGLTAGGLIPCCNLPDLEELDCSSCNCVADAFLEFLHRLFAGPAGSDGSALPALEALPPNVAAAAGGLWEKRTQAHPPLMIKNYYAEYLEDWAQLRPSHDACADVEQLLAREDGISG